MVSRSGQIYRPIQRKSSPVFTITVRFREGISAARPVTSFAAPTPPASAVTFMAFALAISDRCSEPFDAVTCSLLFVVQIQTRGKCGHAFQGPGGSQWARVEGTKGRNQGCSLQDTAFCLRVIAAPENVAVELGIR